MNKHELIQPQIFHVFRFRDVSKNDIKSTRTRATVLCVTRKDREPTTQNHSHWQTIISLTFWITMNCSLYLVFILPFYIRHTPPLEVFFFSFFPHSFCLCVTVMFACVFKNTWSTFVLHGEKMYIWCLLEVVRIRLKNGRRRK